MRRWLKEHGLLVANLVLFLVFFGGMIVSGAANYNEDQLTHHQQTVSLLQYLGTGDFMEATFENWESEFLQMGMYVVLTAFLFQRGSSESKPLDGTAPQDEDPADHVRDPGAPWAVRKGGIVLKVYENSLSILFFALFFASIALHAVGGAAAYSDEQAAHGQPPVTVWQYLGTSRFWFESFQNWQSEFMVVALIVLGSVYLRQRGSAESKPVAASNSETGA